MIWQSEWQWQIIHFLGLSLSAMMEAQFLRIRFGPKLYHAIKSFITWLTFFITWKKPVKYDNLLRHFQHTKCDTIRVSVSWNLSKYSLFSFPRSRFILQADWRLEFQDFFSEYLWCLLIGNHAWSVCLRSQPLNCSGCQFHVS